MNTRPIVILSRRSRAGGWVERKCDREGGRYKVRATLVVAAFAATNPCRAVPPAEPGANL